MSKTTIIGDSITVGEKPYFKKPNIDALGGRNSTAGLAALKKRLRTNDKVVVFDLGTNDGSVAETKRNLRRAKKLVGNRRLIVSTVNSPWDQKSKNNFIKQFAANNDNVVLVRGHKFARRPGASSDGIHLTPEGYRKRARLIKKQIRGGGPKVSVAPMDAAHPREQLGVPTSLRELLARGYSGRRPSS
jgi:hypothetical protein